MINGMTPGGGADQAGVQVGHEVLDIAMERGAPVWLLWLTVE